MKYEVALRPAAERDLDAIAVYTKQRWGKRQARTYVGSLRFDIESLAEFPMRYPVHRCGQQEFRKLSSGHHVVFYQIHEDTIHVIRILHERMDLDEHLENDRR